MRNCRIHRRKTSGSRLLDGLTKLEYRGYDSAGIAVLDPDGNIVIEKARVD